MNKQSIRVLIVDDSALIRHAVTKYLNEYEGIEVVGTARDGEDALKRIPKLQPDVVVLDVEMPRMDGLTALRIIITQWSIPVIMLSALTKEGASTTIRALMRGAVDFVAKPDIKTNIQSVIEELSHKIKAAVLTSPTHAALDVPTQSTPETVTEPIRQGPQPLQRGDRLIIVGTSTGGPRALREILPQFPATMPAAMLIVQHMPVGFTHTLAQSLNTISALTIHEATNGDRLARGLALMAAGGQHLRVQNRRVHLDESPPRNHVRPSVDVTIETAVKFFGASIIGVILTGMGEDGKAGAKLIKDAGGYVIVESESTSVVYGMPGSVAKAGLADQILPLPKIVPAILERIGNG